MLDTYCRFIGVVVVVSVAGCLGYDVLVGSRTGLTII